MRDSFVGLWHCLWFLILFVIWKLGFKNVFDAELSVVFVFIALWKDKVHHQLFSKGAWLIKATKSLALAVYSNFIFASVTKRL